MNPRCGIYASLGNTDATLTGHPERIAKLARWDDVILDLGPAIEQPQIIAALRAANPTIRLHAYVVMKAYNWPGAFFQELNGTIASIGGYLYAKDGEMWRDSNINTARPDVAREVARVIAKYLDPSWHAVFLDVFCAQMQNATASGVDWRRAGFDSEKAFMEAWQGGHAALVQWIRFYTGRPDLAISGNCGPRSHADMNGWMREAFPTQNGGTWESNCLEYVTPAWTAPGVLREVYREPRASWICSAPAMNAHGIYEPLDAENQRRHRYGLASACLGGAFHSMGRYEADERWCRDRLDFFYPDYQHPQRGKGWLGEATAPAVHLTESKGKPVDLWVRYFERGVVVVNPSSQPHSYYSGIVRYRPLGGVAKTAWSIPAHDALIAEAV